MIKVMQYGEGNFLRTFVDAYFHTLNEEGSDYGVYIVKPITFGTLERFEKQNNLYNIILRGVEDGKAVEKVHEIRSLQAVIDPFVDDKAECVRGDKKAFYVKKDANKTEIKLAVEKLFGVQVAKVNTLNSKGKLKRMGRNQGYTPDRKKAIVTLKADSKAIEFFESLT